MISTPKQLIVTVILAFAVPLVIILLAVQYITGGIKSDPSHPEMSETAITARLTDKANATPTNQEAPQPTEPVVTVGPGEGLYNSVCQACHVAGVAGAPKTGDAAAWAPRINNGKDYLYNSVINGKNMMPARGGATNASDDDIKAAVDFMLSKVQ